MSHDGDWPARLASLVRGHRQAAGWTQQQLASRSGLSVGAVRDVEQGRTGRPRPASMRRLADCLDLDQARRGELLAALPHAPGPDGSSAPAAWPCRDGQPAAGPAWPPGAHAAGPEAGAQAWPPGPHAAGLDPRGPEANGLDVGAPAWPPGPDVAGLDPRGPGASGLDTASRRVRVAVLGPLAASRGGAALRLGPDRQRAVLGLLALEPGVPLHRDAIIDALWGAWAPASAAAMVQCYVSRLRRILHGGPPRDGVLSGTGRGYQLEAGHGLDLPRFRQAAQRARAALVSGDPAAACAHYERGLAWWRGDPLADIGMLREHPAVQLLRRQRAAMIVDYADAACAAGEPGRALPALGQLAGAEPLDERVHARLMVALACTGQQAAALGLYRRLTTRLDRDLGVRPGPELATAHDRVLRQDLPGAAWARPAPAVLASPASPQSPASAHSPASPGPVLVPRQLPAPVPRLAGRAAELGALDLLLHQAGQALAPGVAVITGPPGVGKTALAVHWAHTASDRFPDGQLYVPLHGSGPAGPAEAQAGGPEAEAGPGRDVLPGLLGALGLPPDLVPGGADAQAALLRSLLAGKRMLLVLDDAASSGQAAPLLPGCAGCLVLVTSRAPLTGLVAARSARVLTLTALDQAAAWEMLAGRLGPGRLAAEAGAVAELADVCARLPATLAAVAAHAAAHPGLPLAALAADLRAAAPRLGRPRPARPAAPAAGPRPGARLSW